MLRQLVVGTLMLGLVGSLQAQMSPPASYSMLLDFFAGDTPTVVIQRVHAWALQHHCQPLTAPGMPVLKVTCQEGGSFVLQPRVDPQMGYWLQTGTTFPLLLLECWTPPGGNAQQLCEAVAPQAGLPR